MRVRVPPPALCDVSGHRGHLSYDTRALKAISGVRPPSVRCGPALLRRTAEPSASERLRPVVSELSSDHASGARRCVDVHVITGGVRADRGKKCWVAKTSRPDHAVFVRRRE